jgi:hypothetical protein
LANLVCAESADSSSDVAETERERSRISALCVLVVSFFWARREMRKKAERLKSLNSGRRVLFNPAPEQKSRLYIHLSLPPLRVLLLLRSFSALL